MEFFLFTTVSRPAMGPTQPRDTRDSYPGVKQLGSEPDHPPPPRVKMKNAWNYTSLSQHIFMVW